MGGFFLPPRLVFQIYRAVEKEVLAWTQIVIDVVFCCAGERVRRSFRPVTALSSDLLGRKALRPQPMGESGCKPEKRRLSARREGGFLLPLPKF
jgi:hypothetical protein